jgi:DNA-binding response OmpR family regulator
MKKKILVIEDDENVALGVKIRLRTGGYDALTAPNGVVGLKLVLQEKPDLVITDIWMPNGGGFSMAYRLRESNPHLPVIFVTASKKPGLREDAQKLGAVGFIEKPYEAAKLLKMVAEALAVTPSPAADSVQHLKTESHTSKPPEVEPIKVEPHKVEPPKPEPVGITRRNKILMVEDDRQIVRALTLRLQYAGYEVIQAFDAVSGVEAVIQHQPDLILMDIILPGGSGLIAAKKIQNTVSNLPIIFLTASQRPGLRQQALALGAAGFLEKPYDPRELLNTIQNALTAAVAKAPGSKTPAPTTPVSELELQLANLRMADSSSNAPKSQPQLVRIIGRNKILIVEHDRRIAKNLTLQLQNAGQEVIQASDEMSGVVAATQHQPDLILMDINLPSGSGLTAAQKIQSVVPKLIPMIFLTAGQQPELRQQALTLGAAGFLEKSCDPDILFHTIQDTLSLGRGCPTSP